MYSKHQKQHSKSYVFWSCANIHNVCIHFRYPEWSIIFICEQEHPNKENDTHCGQHSANINEFSLVIIFFKSRLSWRFIHSSWSYLCILAHTAACLGSLTVLPPCEMLYIWRSLSPSRCFYQRSKRMQTALSPSSVPYVYNPP